MYLYNIHILFYVLFCILGIIASQIAAWCIKRMPEHKKIISKDFFKEFKINYILMIITVILYLVLLVMHGIKNQFLSNLQLIKYTILTPMLLIAFVIDYKHQIIPNRLNLTIFEVGLASALVSGLYSMNMMTDALIGMLVRRRSIPNNNPNRRINCRKRSYGVWRRKIHGSPRTILWISKYSNYNPNGIPICRSNKHIFIGNKNKKEKRIHTIWTIHCSSMLYRYVSTI